MTIEGSLNVEPMRTTSKVAFNGSFVRLKVQSRTSVLAPLRVPWVAQLSSPREFQGWSPAM